MWSSWSSAWPTRRASTCNKPLTENWTSRPKGTTIGTKTTKSLNNVGPPRGQIGGFFLVLGLEQNPRTLRLQLSFSHDRKIQKSIQITGSKSETNRALLLQALFPTIQIENLSNSDDGELMQKGVKQAKGTVDIHHAGTAMRFLTAYFASSPGKEVVLTGSGRMQERPVQILVDALRELGADIEDMKEQGNPPLKIRGRKLTGSKVSLPAGISSQYISALLLIAPALEHGLELELVGKITSVPYIKMTLGLLDQIGIETSFEG